MQIISNLNRMAIQLAAQQRILRTLRAELENHISRLAPADIGTSREVLNGLSDLFINGRAISPFTANAYEDFYPGLQIGIDPDAAGTGVTAAVRTLHYRDLDGGTARASRLSINPVFPFVEKPNWLTLEAACDVPGAQTAKKFQVEIICFFEILQQNTVSLPRTLSLTMRVKHTDGHFKDHLHYAIPVSTMPFEHTILVSEKVVNDMNMAEAEQLVLIFELPLAGEFILHIDYFSLKSIGMR